MSFLVNLAFLFRLMGDAAHVLSMFILVKKIKKTRSCSGLSYKTQILKLIVFLTRYMDLFDFKKAFIGKFFSTMKYNFFMKIAYISFQLFLLYRIRFSYFSTYESSLDDFRIEFLIGPSGFISILLVGSSRDKYKITEYFYSFSLLLESVSILPQLTQLQKMQESESLTSSYIFLLGNYRLFYSLNWIIKLIDRVKVDELLVATGILQTIMYVHFFYLFYGYIIKGRGFKTIRR